MVFWLIRTLQYGLLKRKIFKTTTFNTFADLRYQNNTSKLILLLKHFFAISTERYKYITKFLSKHIPLLYLSLIYYKKVDQWEAIAWRLSPLYILLFQNTKILLYFVKRFYDLQLMKRLGEFSMYHDYENKAAITAFHKSKIIVRMICIFA